MASTGLGKQRKQDMTRKRSQGTLILELFYLLVLFVLFSSCQPHQVLNEELANLKIMASIRQSSDSHEVAVQSFQLISSIETTQHVFGYDLPEPVGDYANETSRSAFLNTQHYRLPKDGRFVVLFKDLGAFENISYLFTLPCGS